MTNIEKLKKEVGSIETSLKELKDNIWKLSEDDKKKQVEELKTKVEEAKQKINNRITELSDKTDDNSKKEIEEAKQLLESLESSVELQREIIENKTDKKGDWWDKDKKEWKVEWVKDWDKKWWKLPEQDGKNIFWKSWDWIKDQRNDVWNKEKWKEEWFTNALRTAWFVVTWVWAVALTVKWVKKLWDWAFWDDEDEEDDEVEEEKKSKKKKKKRDDWESFWDGSIWKFLKWAGTVLWVWTWVYYLAHWLYTQNRWLSDLWDRERGKKLEFDEAMSYASWAVSNQNDKEGMSYGLNLKYHEDTWEIEAYGERIKINKNKKMIDWLNVEFKKYENMICAAILIAYLKKAYSWKCTNNNPFHLNWSWQWDINVNASNGDEEAVDWTGNWGRIVWVTAGWIAGIVTWIFGWLKAWATVTTVWWIVWYVVGDAYDKNNIMNDLMPELDDENSKKRLEWYLNDMKCRQSKNQIESDIAESPIKEEVVKVMKNIQETHKELESRWARRQINAIPDSIDEKKYTIKAYGRNFSAEVTWNKWERKIKILWISGWNPKIETDMKKSWLSNLELPLEEWLYMSCFVWYLLDNFHHKWNDYPRFEYTRKALKFLRVRQWIWWETWVYFSDSWLDTRVLSKDKFKERMPTLFQEENRNKFLEFLNDWIMDWETNISIRKKMDYKII